MCLYMILQAESQTNDACTVQQSRGRSPHSFEMLQAWQWCDHDQLTDL